MFNGLSDQECIDLKEYRRNAERARVLNPIRINKRGRVESQYKIEKSEWKWLFVLVLAGVPLSYIFLSFGGYLGG